MSSSSCVIPQQEIKNSTIPHLQPSLIDNWCRSKPLRHLTCDGKMFLAHLSPSNYQRTPSKSYPQDNV